MAHDMTDLYERRRKNLAALLVQHESKQQLAIRLEMNPTNISHWLRPLSNPASRKIKEETARRIEAIMGLPVGTLDRNPDVPVASASPRNGRPIDASLLAATTRAVLLEVQALKGKPMIDKIADVVQLAYSHNSEHGSLDEAYIHQLVKLMN